MPRVDAGIYLLEVSKVLRLPESDIGRLVEWALSESPLVALEPGVASIHGPGGAVLVAFGPLSVFSEEEPPVGSPWVLARPEWVTGCRAGEREPAFREARGPAEEVSGVVVARAYRDPVASLVNGLQGLHRVVKPSSLEGFEVYAEVSGRPLLAYSLREGYLSLAAGGEAGKRIAYAARLASSCSG